MVLRLLVTKECKAILLSPRFLGTFSVVAVLMLLSIGIGVQEYRSFVATQDRAMALLAEEQAEATEWMALGHRVFRRIDPLAVFATGVHNDVGRLSTVGVQGEAKLRRSVYADDPVFAVFRSLDLTFIVQVVLSLFAIMMSYDSISGEREQGTLQLTFASPVPRARYLLAKLAGTWLGLTLPLLVPLVAGALLVVVFGVPMTAGDWTRLGVLLLASCLYFTFFIVLGLAVSTLTRRSSTSFLVLLVAWIAIVLVLPRAGVLAAVDLIPVPSASELDSRKAGFERRQWEENMQATSSSWNERQRLIEAQPVEERDEFEDTKTWEWMQEDERERAAVQARIAEQNRLLNEEMRNLKARQEQLGLTLSRVSPAAAFQLIAVRVAGTGLEMRQSYVEAIDEYERRFAQYLESKGGRRMVFGRNRRSGAGEGEGTSSGGGWTDQGRPVDLRDMPRFVPPTMTASDAIAPTIPELTLLALMTLAAFAVAFTSFLRYDVRPG